MYTIKHAAELTGVPVATLRAWERRYGVVTPRRTDSGYRLYDEQSLNTITAIRDLRRGRLVGQQAATEVQRRQADPVPQPATKPATATAPERERPFAELVAAAADLDPTEGVGPVGRAIQPRIVRGCR